MPTKTVFMNEAKDTEMEIFAVPDHALNITIRTSTRRQIWIDLGREDVAKLIIILTDSLENPALTASAS